MKKLFIQGTTEFSNARYRGSEYSETCIGGNGVITSLAASKIIPVGFISCVGSDLPVETLKKVLGERVSVENVKKLRGKTFRWKATYHPETYELIDQDIVFGAYENFHVTELTSEAQATGSVFFSGSRPQLGLESLSLMKGPEIIGVDVLLFHLQYNYEAAEKLLKKATHIFMNESEYQFLIKKLGEDLFSHFPQALMVFRKLGKEGVDVLTKDSSRHFSVVTPVIPLDPTNAGDAFAGIVMGYLAKGEDLEKNLEKVIEEAQTEACNVIMNDSYYRKLHEA